MGLNHNPTKASAHRRVHARLSHASPVRPGVADLVHSLDFDATSCARRSVRSRRSCISTLRNGNCPRAVARIPAPGGKPGNPERNDRACAVRARACVGAGRPLLGLVEWGLTWPYNASSAVSLGVSCPSAARVPTNPAGSDSGPLALAVAPRPAPMPLSSSLPFRSTRRLRRGARAPSPMGTLGATGVCGAAGLALGSDLGGAP